jgi:hypothetical protein
MKQISTTSIPDLLMTKEFECNQSELAKHLNTSRNTIRAYKNDSTNLHHFVIKTKAGFTLFTKTGGW